MTAYTKEQSMFIFLGDGANGKSLLLETFTKIMGSYSTTSSVDILVERSRLLTYPKRTSCTHPSSHHRRDRDG